MNVVHTLSDGSREYHMFDDRAVVLVLPRNDIEGFLGQNTWDMINRLAFDSGAETGSIWVLYKDSHYEFKLYPFERCECSIILNGSPLDITPERFIAQFDILLDKNKELFGKNSISEKAYKETEEQITKFKDWFLNKAPKFPSEQIYRAYDNSWYDDLIRSIEASKFYADK